ncbi:MAG: hypothetical protein ACOZIN_07870 [Myxococcota bacterium]
MRPAALLLLLSLPAFAAEVPPTQAVAPVDGTAAPKLAEPPSSNLLAPALRLSVGHCAAERLRGLFEGPVAFGYYEADVATGRRACPRTEIGLGAKAGAVIDTPDFYGGIAADALLFGSYALDDTRELFATLELLHYQFVQNATLKGTSLGLGQLTAGMSFYGYQSGAFRGSTSARLMLPTSTLGNARIVGAELGHALSWRGLSKLEVHGYLGLDFSAALSAGPALPRLGGLANVGVQYSPLPWLGLVLDVNTHIGGATDYLAPALALRVGTRSFGAELGATLPLLGNDRHDAVGGIRLAYRL